MVVVVRGVLEVVVEEELEVVVELEVVEVEDVSEVGVTPGHFDPFVVPDG